MKKLNIKENQIETVFQSKFMNVYDMHYKENSHYYNASRRIKENLVCLKNTEEFQNMRPDAVSCVLILNMEEPKLVLCHEFRYPTGQFLLGVPAGLMDEEDCDVIETAQREIKEECGIHVKREQISIINPLLFSTPGMSDESNALVCVKVDSIQNLNADGCEGSELFDGYSLLTIEDALRILKNGKDDNHIFYSVYTWAALMVFVSKIWL